MRSMTLNRKTIRSLLKLFILLTVAFLVTSKTYANCERNPYVFAGPDQYIKLLKSVVSPAKGTILISHGGTGGRAGPLSNNWAKFFNAHGYDAVVLNHFPQRGLLESTCKATYPEADSWRREDALAVMKWLTHESKPAPQKIFLMGFSAGTASVFPFITDSRFQSDLPSPNIVSGGILFYPWAYGCMNPPQKLTKPTLFLGASEDNVMRCWESSNWLKQAVTTQLMTLKVIEGAMHAFDNPSMKSKKCTQGGRYPYCMEYNPDAHKLAEQQVLNFLKAQ